MPTSKVHQNALFPHKKIKKFSGCYCSLTTVTKNEALTATDSSTPLKY